MKKYFRILLFILLVAVVFTLSGCQSAFINHGTAEDNTETIETPPVKSDDDVVVPVEDVPVEIIPTIEIDPEIISGPGIASIEIGGYIGDYIKSDGMIVSGMPIYEGIPGIVQPGTISSGTLTAKALFDNNNFAYWKSLIGEGDEQDGKFASYQKQFGFAMNRITLKFTDAPLAKVTLLNDNDEVEWEAYADKLGTCYLFNKQVREEYKIKVTYLDSNNELSSKELVVKNEEEITLGEESNYKNVIQLMFVIDTTGSMMDEIAYLKVEITDVIKRIKEANDDVTIYLAIMVYRDLTDQYLTRYFDFTTDIEAQVENLSQQYAQGGGDFEEAVHIAFQKANEAQWLDMPSTKVLVHVADAPAHTYDVANWFSSVKALASKGVRIITVASSGINSLTEYYFRSQSIQTNGCYAYLTDHSGIGGSHLEATTEEDLPVECLNDLLVRVINGMHTGTYAEPIVYGQQIVDDPVVPE